MNLKSRRTWEKSGHTLIETLISILILGIAAAIFYSIGAKLLYSERDVTNRLLRRAKKEYYKMLMRNEPEGKKITVSGKIYLLSFEVTERNTLYREIIIRIRETNGKTVLSLLVNVPEK
jgi:prepilin-type N-terminal cleavage/methylation domain-containing protein